MAPIAPTFSTIVALESSRMARSASRVPRAARKPRRREIDRRPLPFEALERGTRSVARAFLKEREAGDEQRVSPERRREIVR